MKKIYIGLCLTLLICNSSFSVDPRSDFVKSDADKAQQLIRALLQSGEDNLAHKGELIIAGEKQNKIRRIALTTGPLIAAGCSLFLQYSAKKSNRWDSQENAYVSCLELKPSLWKKIILIYTFSLVIIGIGAYLPYTDTKSMQTDIDQENIERLPALAALQTKNASSPETNATSEEVVS